MLILSNGFPTSLPDSEKVSQGGPANFARLFVNHIVYNSKHHWIGVMFEGVSTERTSLKKVFSAVQRDYYRLNAPRSSIRKITEAKNITDDPLIILQKPIDKVVKLIQEKKPDIIFLNGFGLFNWILLQAGRIANVPVVTQHAGIWNKELLLHKKLYTEAGRKIMEQMERDSSLISKAEVFLNKCSKDYYNNTVIKTRENNSFIIPLPFDFKSFENLNKNKTTSLFNFNKKHFHIGVIARWDEIKNHKAVMEVAKKTKKMNLCWQFHSVVEIPNSTKYKKEKKQYSRYVDVIDPLDRSGVSDFCHKVDLLWLPSLFDVSPTVVLEAIASGTPIIISPNVGYVNDFISFGAEAWVVSTEDSDETIKEISMLLRKKMPEELKNHLNLIHDHKKVFEKYLNLFSNISKKDKFIPFSYTKSYILNLLKRENSNHRSRSKRTRALLENSSIAKSF